MRTTLYRYYNSDDELLYVGITGGGSKRQAQHSRKSAWFSEVKYAHFEHFDTRDEASQAELRAIYIEQPKHNRTNTVKLTHSDFTHMIQLAGHNEQSEDRTHKAFSEIYRRVFNQINGTMPNYKLHLVEAMMQAKDLMPEAENLTFCELCTRSYQSDWFVEATKEIGEIQ